MVLSLHINATCAHGPQVVGLWGGPLYTNLTVVVSTRHECTTDSIIHAVQSITYNITARAVAATNYDYGATDAGGVPPGSNHYDVAVTMVMSDQQTPGVKLPPTQDDCIPQPDLWLLCIGGIPAAVNGIFAAFTLVLIFVFTVLIISLLVWGSKKKARMSHMDLTNGK